MKYTLLLVLVTTLSYFLFSSSNFFIPIQSISNFGLSFENIFGVITYPFLHISLNHLIGNMCLLMAIGFVAESRLNRKDFFAIYFLSSIATGLVVAFFAQNTILIGASAAVAGLVIPACLIDFKKVIVYLVLFGVLSFMLTSAADFAVSSTYTFSQNQTTELEHVYNDTVQQRTLAVGNISTLEDRFRSGEINETQYNQSRQTLVSLIENLTKMQNSTANQLSQAKISVLNIEEGISREQASETSTPAHVVGSLVGLGYIALFERGIIWNSGYQVSRLEQWLRRQRKNWRKRGSRKSSR